MGHYFSNRRGIGLGPLFESWRRKLVALIVRYSQKKDFISFVFYCLENPSIAYIISYNFDSTGPIQQNVPLQMSTSFK